MWTWTTSTGGLSVKKNSGNAIELSYVQLQLEAIPDETVRLRTENTLLWYIRKANRSRAAYYIATVISIAASAAIPVINTLGASSGGGFSLKDMLISLIAAIGGVAASVCVLFNFKEAWNRNRRYAEALKSECFLFATHSEDYARDDAMQIFIRKLEGLASEENKSWAETNKKNSHQGV
jgi:hypothetical protein